MAEDGVIPLPLPSPSDDVLVAERLRQSYEAIPSAPEAQVAACVEGVLAQSTRRPDGARSFAFGRSRWWWGGAAAAALLIVATLRPARMDDSSRSSVDSATAENVSPAGSTTIVDGGRAIRFDIRLPVAASRVALVGDFNGWDSDATLMEPRPGNGAWTAKIPLTPGVHNYAFVVDGQRWMIDPLAPQVPDAGFGPANAVVVVGSL